MQICRNVPTYVSGPQYYLFFSLTCLVCFNHINCNQSSDYFFVKNSFDVRNRANCSFDVSILNIFFTSLQVYLLFRTPFSYS